MFCERFGCIPGLQWTTMVSPGQLSESMHPAAYSQESSISNNLPGAGARSQDQQPTQPRRPNSTVEQQSSASSRNQEASGASDHKQGSHQPPASQQSPSSQETSLEPMEGANSSSHWQPDHPAFNLQPAASSHQVPVSCLQPI